MKFSDTLLSLFGKPSAASTYRIEGEYYKVGDDGDTLIALSLTPEEKEALNHTFSKAITPSG